MEVDKKLVEKALLVLNKIEVEIDFDSVGEFVENFVLIANKVFVTLGRVHGFKNITIYDEYASNQLGSLRYDMEDDGYTVNDRQGKIYTFYISGRLEDYDADATEEDYFGIENDDLGKLKLTDIPRIKELMKGAIEEIKKNFTQINRSMKEVKSALDDIGGLSS